MSISGFGSHFWLSIIIANLESPQHTFYELAIVKYLRFAVGILVLSVIPILPVWIAILLFPVVCQRCIYLWTLLLSFPW